MSDNLFSFRKWLPFSVLLSAHGTAPRGICLPKRELQQPHGGTPALLASPSARVLMLSWNLLDEKELNVLI